MLSDLGSTARPQACVPLKPSQSMPWRYPPMNGRRSCCVSPRAWTSSRMPTRKMRGPQRWQLAYRAFELEPLRPPRRPRLSLRRALDCRPAVTEILGAAPAEVVGAAEWYAKRVDGLGGRVLLEREPALARIDGIRLTIWTGWHCSALPLATSSLCGPCWDPSVASEACREGLACS